MISIEKDLKIWLDVKEIISVRIVLENKNKQVIMDTNEQASSSDTDSVTTPNVTPTHSPSQRPKLGSEKSGSRPPSMLKPSDSSFGLHSPDVLPNNGEEKDLEGLLRRLQDDPNLPFPFAEGTLYLDPDIIDLTMIPPPITPEEDGIKFPVTLNEPPTPFADRETLENELSTMAKNPRFLHSAATDLGELKDLTDLAQWADVVSDTASLNDSRDETESEDALSLSGISATTDRSVDSLYSAASSSVKSLTESKRRWIADEKRKYLATNPELDKFLAAVAVPPPPASGATAKGSESMSTTTAPSQVSDFSDDFSAYIIPPPPANVDNTANNGLAILQKLYEAREGIFQVMSNDTATTAQAPATPAKSKAVGEPSDEKDRAIAEVRVRSERREQPHHHSGVSRKIGEMQRIFSAGSTPTTTTTVAPVTEALAAGTTATTATKGTTPDLSPSSSHSSGYGSLKSIAESSSAPPPELPARVPTGHFSPRKNGYNNLKAPIMSRITGLHKSIGLKPAGIADDAEDYDDIPPPPPPPRNSLPRIIGSGTATSPTRTPVSRGGPPRVVKEANTAATGASATAAAPGIARGPGFLTKSSSQVTDQMAILRLKWHTLIWSLLDRLE